MEEQNQNQENNFKEYFLPVSILIAAVLISGSLIYTASNGSQGDMAANTENAANNNSASNVAEVTEDDHIRGSQDAKIKIVEFSDLECPFCQRFHSTMKQVMENYSDDEVAWVYRHFPLGGHPQAMPAAEASECVADIAGEDAFWSFVDRIFEGQNQLGSGLIEEVAGQVGVSSDDLQACLDSDKFLSEINSEKKNAVDSGARGTPFSVIVVSNGEYIPAGGALSYPDLSQTLDQILETL